MTFPVIFHPLGLSLHAHAVFEALSYAVGFQTYLYFRRRDASRMDTETMLWMIAGCITGALLGSKVLAWLESWPTYWAMRHEPAMWLGGKTIVGGLLGGWGGVEIARKILGVRSRTGDAYAAPLCIGIAIGRIGCFLAGLDDHTHGVATSLPWGVDFGDGLRRHPTQLYEIGWLATLAVILVVTGRRNQSSDTVVGARFRFFIFGYMLFRFLVEFIKPSWKGYGGLSAIQWVALTAAGFAVFQILRSRSATPSIRRVTQGDIA